MESWNSQRKKRREIRSLRLDEVLNQRSCTNSDENSQDVPEVVPDDSDSSQDQAIAALRRVMDQSSQSSLRYRQVSRMLDARLDERERRRQWEERNYEDRQRRLMAQGVTREHVDLLPRDPSDPWPTQITNDVDAFRQETLRKEINAKRERAVKAFQRPWLLQTEQQLHECTALLQQRDLDHERRRSMEAYIPRSFARQAETLFFYCFTGPH